MTERERERERERENSQYSFAWIECFLSGCVCHIVFLPKKNHMTFFLKTIKRHQPVSIYEPWMPAVNSMLHVSEGPRMVANFCSQRTDCGFKVLYVWTVKRNVNTKVTVLSSLTISTMKQRWLSECRWEKWETYWTKRCNNDTWPLLSVS